MRKRIFATFSSLALLTAAAVFAQSNEVMRFDIPFDFHVGTTVLPAGHYSVHPQASMSGRVLLIRGIDRKSAVMYPTNAATARKMPETGKLVFNRYDKTYFLSSVWTAGDPQGRELLKSKAELEFARNGSPIRTEQVVLARR